MQKRCIRIGESVRKMALASSSRMARKGQHAAKRERATVDAPPHNRKRELTVVCTGWPPTRAKSSVGAAAQHNTSRAKQSAAQHNQVQRKRPKWSPGRHFLPSLVCARDSQSQK